MDRVDAAEKEASEVLHKLLSVERIEKPNFNLKEHNQVVVVVTCAGASAPSSTETQQQSSCQDVQHGHGPGTVRWCAPVTLHHSLFSTIADDDEADYGEGRVVWEGDTGELAMRKRQKVRARSSSSSEQEKVDDVAGEPLRAVQVVKRTKKYSHVRETGSDQNQLEDNVNQVRERLERHCECQEQNCFKGLNAENVYRHRLNIAELTKEEHDMYLMGVTMAVLTNPELTVRHKERRRLRSQYVFQGRRVCLDAFLYLENCTHYQLKRIRKHVMTRGVVPRVHGNHGKKPHNTFSLDIYRHATMFLKHFISTHTSTSSPQGMAQSSSGTQSTDNKKTVSKTPPLYLPPEVTWKTIHNAYRDYCELFEPTIKVMGYSTFRHFMKEQFPHVKFCKIETTKLPGQQSVAGAAVKSDPEAELKGGKHTLEEKDAVDSAEDSDVAPQLGEGEGVNVKIQELPVVFSDGGAVPRDKQTTFIVAPVSQIIQGPSIVASTEAYPSYQLATAPAECFASQSEVETITVTPVIGNPLATAYSFTAL